MPDVGLRRPGRAKIAHGDGGVKDDLVQIPVTHLRNRMRHREPEVAITAIPSTTCAAVIDSAKNPTCVTPPPAGRAGVSGGVESKRVPEPSPRNPWKMVGRYMSLAMLLPSCVLVGYIIGYLLDKAFRHFVSLHCLPTDRNRGGFYRACPGGPARLQWLKP